MLRSVLIPAFFALAASRMRCRSLTVQVPTSIPLLSLRAVKASLDETTGLVGNLGPFQP